MKDARKAHADHQLSEQDFAVLGLNQLAYVRPIRLDGHDAFAIHAANGVQLAVFDSLDAALLAARGNELETFGIH